MTPQENKHAKIIHRAEFRMAMQEVFGWRLPLPDKILAALANSEDFDRLLEETQKNDEPRFSRQHFQRFAMDQRVEFLVKELIAAEGDYLTPLVKRILPLLGEKFDQLVRWLLRPQKPGEAPKPRRPVPVFKTTVLALASYAAYFAYHHHLQIDLVLPRESSTIHVETAPLKVEPAQVSFAPLRFDPGEIKFGRVQFAGLPQLKVQPLSFTDPLQFKIASFPELKITNGGQIQLDTSSAHIDINPLQFKQDTEIPIRFDPQSLGRESAFQLAIHNVWDMPSTGFPVIHVKDKRDRLFWPSHNYTLTVEQGHSDGGNTKQTENKKDSPNTPKQTRDAVGLNHPSPFAQEQP